MPDGGVKAACEHCLNLDTQPSRRVCRKHNFLVPFTGELVCRDFAHIPESTPFKALEPGFLYNYVYYPEKGLYYTQQEKFRRFADLQNRLWFTRLQFDKEFGWSISRSKSQFPDLDYLFGYNQLPPPGSKLTLLFGQEQSEFEARLVQRIVHNVPANVHLIFNPTQPQLLHDWFSPARNLEKDGNLQILLEELEENKAYQVIPSPFV